MNITIDNIKEVVQHPVTFSFFRNGMFFYKTFDGQEFGVPLEDIGSATLLNQDKGIFFMRWIRMWGKP